MRNYTNTLPLASSSQSPLTSSSAPGSTTTATVLVDGTSCPMLMQLGTYLMLQRTLRARSWIPFKEAEVGVVMLLCRAVLQYECRGAGRGRLGTSRWWNVGLCRISACVCVRRSEGETGEERVRYRGIPGVAVFFVRFSLRNEWLWYLLSRLFLSSSTSSCLSCLVC